MDSSAPATLQLFEASWSTMENRAPDIFAAGYGGLWTPPPGLANSGTDSVGYDVYDRFNLGSPDNPTRYGTQTGLQAAIASMHKIGVSVYTDLVWNHDGTSDATTTSGTKSFAAAGGYPGLAVTLQSTDPTKPGYNSQGYNNANGDFHPASAQDDQSARLAGLIDIAQESNYQLIRNPVNASDPRNIPAGSYGIYNFPAANVAKASNTQFYPDRDAGGKTYTDPGLGGQSLTTYDFNTSNPSTGDAVPENATGYLMRNARWMMEVIGVDGFRIDAAKEMPNWVLNYYDEAVIGTGKTLLDGSKQTPFAFSEVYTSDFGTLQDYIRKDTATVKSGEVSGNRDDLDFPLFFAMQSNLSNNGLANNWNNVKNASIDKNDDQLANNGSQGVSFVQSADNGAPYLSNVAYAYTLMRPGNTIVYDNAHSLTTSTGNPTFAQDGRGDALGGMYGNIITTLVDIRNTHGRGDYMDRTPDADTKEMLIYERKDSALVVLSNRLDGGYDNRTIQTAFPAGTPLVELTGNAANATVDPTHVFSDFVVVNSSGQVNINVPRNLNVNGVETDKGYLIYGPSGPRGTLTLGNTAGTIAGGTPTAATNGSTRLASTSIIKANTFSINLATTAVTLTSTDNATTVRDPNADGDYAVVSIDNDTDVNGNGAVDNVTPGSVTYGFDSFLTVNQPGYNSSTGNGSYIQNVDTSKLTEGYHYVDVRAFRHRASDEPAILTDFKQTIYVDRLPPVSAVASFDVGRNQTATATRDLVTQSVDETATANNVFLDLPANLTNAQVLAMVGTGNSASAYDRNTFTYRYFNVGSGNHVATVVTTEVDGTTNVQRLIIPTVTTSRGAGLGDLNFDGTYAAGDVTGTSYGMEALVYPTNGANSAAPVTNTQFNAAADINGDGLIDSRDLYAQRDLFKTNGAPAAALNAAIAAVLRRGDINGDGVTNAADIDAEFAHRGSNVWRYDLNASNWNNPAGVADQADIDTLVKTIFQTNYGDATLNGKIDFDDYSAIDRGFTQHLTGWANGDFNGDGKVNFDDYALIDVSFVTQQSAAVALAAQAFLDGSNPLEVGLSAKDVELLQEHDGEFGASYADAFVAAVPEPGSLAVATFAIGLLLHRRRREAVWN